LDQRLDRIGWTRGETCRLLADLLATGDAIRIDNDLRSSCVVNRIDTLVARRVTRFDLVPTLTPHDVDLDQVKTITAAVAGGPHSAWAAAIASLLAARLGIPAELVTAYRTPEQMEPARQLVSDLGRQHANLSTRVAQQPTAAHLLEALAPNTLLVLGAAGGSWLQRQLLGPGHRLVAAAPGGSIIVRDAPRRCFHDAVDPTGIAVGPDLSADDARRLVTNATVPVAEQGRLVGILRRDALEAAVPGMTVADLMEPPTAVMATEPSVAARELAPHFDYGPVPVVDERQRLIGVLPDVAT
jgi:hypothetical protein